MKRRPFTLSCSDALARRLWPNQWQSPIREYDAMANSAVPGKFIVIAGRVPFSVPNQVPRGEWRHD